MQKGQKVILMVLLYCMASWLARSMAFAPPPLLAPARVAQMFTPRTDEPSAEYAMSPRFTRPVEELISVPEATAAERAAHQPLPTSWEGFLDKLRALEAGKRDKVRAIQLGDSELVADGTAGELRRQLAARFGLGGLGFSLPMLPLPWYMRDHWTLREGVGITITTYPFGRGADGQYGPGGAAFEAIPGWHAVADVSHPVAGPCTLSLYFAVLPEGGRVQVIGDGRKVLDAPTDEADAGETGATAAGPGLGVARARLTECPKELELTTTRAATRVFGWSIEYDSPGIVWSNLGMISARIAHLDHYDPDHLKAALGALDPDLVVLTFGLNDAGEPSLPPPDYAERAGMVLRRMREGTPNAACLVTGPYPIGRPRDDGLDPASRNASIINRAQRAAAEANGCVFLDRFALAGGAGTATRWVATRPKILSGDFTHLTVEGGDRMGRAIAGVIFAGVDHKPIELGAFQLHRQTEGAR